MSPQQGAVVSKSGDEGELGIESLQVLRDSREDLGEHEDVHDEDREEVVGLVVDREEEERGEEKQKSHRDRSDFGQRQLGSRDLPT